MSPVSNSTTTTAAAVGSVPGTEPGPESHKSWIIQKYGGTSVGKFLSTIVSEIVPSYRTTNRVAVVCSARSGKTKALGTTNLLLQAASQALEDEDHDVPSLSASMASLPPLGTSTSARPTSTRGLDRQLSELTRNSSSSSSDPLRDETNSPVSPSAGTQPLYQLTVDQILADHLEAARAHVKTPELLASLEQGLKEDCSRLRDFLLAARIIEEISPRTKDVIMGLGERLSCRIVAAALQDQGVPAQLISLENVIDTQFLEESGLASKLEANGGEVSLDHTFYSHLSSCLGDLLRSVPEDHVPVVTGYFGNVPGSILNQVGRGYTDLCAALCSVGTRAEELQIWKEVDGVFTADPRKVPTARLIPAISPEEAAELTYYGSEVIHPFTMEQAIREAIPIRIKNVENPQGQGTVIVPSATQDHGVDGHVNQPVTPSVSGVVTPNAPLATSSTLTMVEKRKLPTAVTIKDDIVVLNVHSNRKTISHDFFARIFAVLNRYGIVVDLIATSEVHVSMAISGSHRHLHRVKQDLSPVGTVSLIRDMAIVSLVGKEMPNAIGVAGKMFTTLAEGNINIELISQGASEISISTAIHRKNAIKAVNMIHEAVLEVVPPTAGSFGRSFF